MWLLLCVVLVIGLALWLARIFWAVGRSSSLLAQGSEKHRYVGTWESRLYGKKVFGGTAFIPSPGNQRDPCAKGFCDLVLLYEGTGQSPCRQTSRLVKIWDPETHAIRLTPTWHPMQISASAHVVQGPYASDTHTEEMTCDYTVSWPPFFSCGFRDHGVITLRRGATSRGTLK